MLSAMLCAPARADAEPDLFIKTIISHEEAYLGEKIVLSYELYSRYGIDSFGFADNVAIDGTVAKDMPENQLKWEYVDIGGEKYVMYEAKRLIIDPIKTGAYTIPSYNFHVNVLTGSGRGFFRTTAPMQLQTEQKDLNVKPLPQDGRPDDFSGIVGNLQIAGNYSRDELDYGDSIALYLTLYGECNLDAAKNSIVGDMAGFSVYEILKNAEEYVEDSRYRAKKDYESILVPERNGSLEIPPISVSYFNPASEKYERAEIPGILITVLGDMPQMPGGAAGLPANEALVINQVKYEDDKKNDYFAFQVKKGTAYKISIGAALLLAAAFALAKLAAKNKKRDPELKSVYRKLMAEKDPKLIYGIFNDMVKRCYGASLKASSKNMIQESLPDAALASKVEEVMEFMESGETGAGTVELLKEKIKAIYRMMQKK
jgi:hypothetical protein